MKYLKTIQRQVAGSLKTFEVHECTVEEVSKFISSNGREMVEVRVSTGETFKGLYNKAVFDFICDNEGSESFIVLWKAPKGPPMLAYVKQIWEDFAAGAIKDEPIVEESHEAFVYMWINHLNDMKYIGKHCGSPDDDYVSSSVTFNEDYWLEPTGFLRTILAYGSNQQMHELETILLLQLKTRMSPLYYNLSDNIRGGNYE